MTSPRKFSKVTTPPVEGKLATVTRRIVEAEARVKLFRNLRNKGLCTKDIFQAAMAQLRSRRVMNKLDRAAIKRDMSVKIRDSSAHLFRLKEQKEAARRELLTVLGGRRYKLKKLTREINREADVYRKKLESSYKKKIDHYKLKQKELPDQQSRRECTAEELVNTPAEPFKEAIIAIDTMEKEKAALPMLCSKDIKLTDCELELLVKGPKFSVRSELDSEMFEVELETMVTKNKYQSENNEENLEDVEMSKEEDREFERKILWEESKNSLVHNWEDNSIILARMKANKYKYNVK